MLLLYCVADLNVGPKACAANAVIMTQGNPIFYYPLLRPGGTCWAVSALMLQNGKKDMIETACMVTGFAYWLGR
jgi:hypothetical protein